MQATARLLGQSTGAALVALVFTLVPGVDGSTAALMVAACAAVVAAGVSFSRLAA
jgi:DHA2 family multidrug resistance protein-like MFS transporter